MPEPFVVRPRAAAPRPRSAGTTLPGRDAAPHRQASRGPLLPDDPVFAPLSPHLIDATTTDVFLNGADRLYVDRGHGAERVGGWRASEDEVRTLAVALISLGGRHIDEAKP